MLGLHRMRALPVKSRTMQINQLRALMYEFGVTFKAGRRAGLAEIRQRIDEVEQAVPGMLFDALRDQLQHIGQLDNEIVKLEKRLAAWQRQEVACRTIAEIRVLAR